MRRKRAPWPIQKVHKLDKRIQNFESKFDEAFTPDGYNLLVAVYAGWRISEFVRLDNLTDRNYVGSVIVNDANGRFYEPSPRRSISAGIQASLQF